MYAIIKDGGRQYRVEAGQELQVDYRDLSKGSELKFEQVLALGEDDGQLRIGAPLLSGVAVTGEVLGVSQGPKLTVQKFRRRKNSRRKNGHRQLHLTVRIGAINA